MHQCLHEYPRVFTTMCVSLSDKMPTARISGVLLVHCQVWVVFFDTEQVGSGIIFASLESIYHAKEIRMNVRLGNKELQDDARLGVFLGWTDRSRPLRLLVMLPRVISKWADEPNWSFD